MNSGSHRKLLIERNCGITAFMKLLGQIAILDGRIRDHVTLAGRSPDHRRLAEMVLDTETFYTVAADALKLAALFLPVAEMKRFVTEPGYKTIQRIRSECVRHAYDKPDGDPYGGFGFGPEQGPVLKAGSGRREGKGYYADFQDFWQILQEYGIIARSSLIVPSVITQPIVTEVMMRRFTGTEPVNW
jgi:hypothetical protein